MARAPGNPEEHIVLYCRPTKLRELRERPWNAKLGEYAGLVHGDLPDRVGTGLLAAYALYRGLKRPMNEAALENRIYAYVSLPSRSFLWPSKDEFVGGGPEPVPRPDDAVFSTYVHVPDDSEPELLAEVRQHAAEHLVPESLVPKIRGEIRYWEWTLSALDDRSVPAFARDRYVTPVWRRQ